MAFNQSCASSALARPVKPPHCAAAAWTAGTKCSLLHGCRPMDLHVSRHPSEEGATVPEAGPAFGHLDSGQSELLDWTGHLRCAACSSVTVVQVTAFRCLFQGIQWDFGITWHVMTEPQEAKRVAGGCVRGIRCQQNKAMLFQQEPHCRRWESITCFIILAFAGDTVHPEIQLGAMGSAPYTTWRGAVEIPPSNSKQLGLRRRSCHKFRSRAELLQRTRSATLLWVTIAVMSHGASLQRKAEKHPSQAIETSPSLWYSGSTTTHASVGADWQKGATEAADLPAIRVTSGISPRKLRSLQLVCRSAPLFESPSGVSAWILGSGSISLGPLRECGREKKNCNMWIWKWSGSREWSGSKAGVQGGSARRECKGGVQGRSEVGATREWSGSEAGEKWEQGWGEAGSGSNAGVKREWQRNEVGAKRERGGSAREQSGSELNQGKQQPNPTHTPTQPQPSLGKAANFLSAAKNSWSVSILRSAKYFQMISSQTKD